MAYVFHRKEPVRDAIVRLSRERLDHALECLADSARDPAEAVHGARQEIKKVRAVLRMVRSQLSRRDFARLNQRLRTAAAHLGTVRDAHIKAETVRMLATHFQGQLAPAAWPRIRAELRHAHDAALKRFQKEKTARNVAHALRRAKTLAARLRVRAKGWKALAPGVKTAYRQGRRAYQAVLHDAAPEPSHEWRKRAKDLGYHVRALQPLWPEQMEALGSELKTLTTHLGDSHDLAVLQQDIADRAVRDSRETETLLALIAQRQQELRTAALALGARFYADKPSIFADRLAGFWRTWRHEKKSQARDAAPSLRPSGSS